MNTTFFESLFNEAKADRIAKFNNLTDEQKEEAKNFYKSHTTGYDQYIDWQHPNNVKWEDFKKAFQAAEESKSHQQKVRGDKIKAAQRQEWEVLFDRPDVFIQGQNEDWIFVSPLSWEACHWMDSVDCGGGKAGWCVGYEKDDHFWWHYVCMGNAFILAFRKDFKEHDSDDDIKYMIQYNSFFDNDNDPFLSSLKTNIGAVWNQPDNSVDDIYPDGWTNDGVRDRFGIERSDLMNMAYKFWEKLFEVNPEAKNATPSEQTGHGAVEYDIDNLYNDDYFMDTFDLEREVRDKLSLEFRTDAIEAADNDITQECNDNMYNWNPVGPWDAYVNSHEGITLEEMVKDYSPDYAFQDESNNNEFQRIVNETVSTLSEVLEKVTKEIDVLPELEERKVKENLRANIKSFVEFDNDTFTFKVVENAEQEDFDYYFDDDGVLGIKFHFNGSNNEAAYPIIDYNVARDTVLLTVKKQQPDIISPFYLTNVPDTFTMMELNIFNDNCKGLINVNASKVEFLGYYQPNFINCDIGYLKSEGTVTLYNSKVANLDLAPTSSHVTNANLQSIGSTIGTITEDSEIYGLASIKGSKIVPTLPKKAGSVLIDKSGLDYVRNASLTTNKFETKVGFITDNIHQANWYVLIPGTTKAKGRNNPDKVIDFNSTSIWEDATGILNESFEDIWNMARV